MSHITKQVVTTREEPYVVCDFCGTEARDEINLGRTDWQWFTGYRPMTFHACPACFKRRRREYDREYDAAQETPGG